MPGVPEAFVLASSGGLTLTISPAEALAFFTEYLQKHCPMIAVVLLAEVKDTTQLLDFLRFLHTDDAPSAKQHCGNWPRQASDN